MSFSSKEEICKAFIKLHNNIRYEIPFEKCSHKNIEITQHGPLEVCIDCGAYFDEEEKIWKQ